jgi:hypothetical protein
MARNLDFPPGTTPALCKVHSPNTLATRTHTTMIPSMSRNSSVGIVTSYGLDGPASIPGNARFFSFPHSVQIDSGAHPASYPMRTVSCPRG